MKLLIKLLMAGGVLSPAFQLVLSNPVGATIGDGSGNATVTAGGGGELGRIGIGVGSLQNYDGMQAVVDLARQSDHRDYGAFTRGVVFDAAHQPTTDFRNVVSTTILAAGVYTIKFNGQATVTASHGTVGTASYNAGANETTVTWTLASSTSGNAFIDYASTKRTSVSATNTGITNVKIFRPGYPTDNSVLFTNEFVSAMQTASVIRGMDFLYANGNSDIAWADRWLPSYADTPPGTTGTPGAESTLGTGQSYELFIALGNAANRDIWINVPVKADDTYITNLANLVKYGSDGVNAYTSTQANPVWAPLNPALNVYVEWGNEIWNTSGGFYGYHWALVLSDAARAVASPYHPINYDATVTSSQFGALRRYIAYRSAFISLAFRAVFGDAAMMTRVRPILSSQIADGNAYLSLGLQWAEAYYSAVRGTVPANSTIRTVPQLWYGGGGAAYWGSTAGTPTDTLPATMTAYFAGVPNASFATGLKTDLTWLKGYGLKFVSYEGGPGPGGSSTGAITDASLGYTYNMDSRMQAAMVAAQLVYDEVGCDELVYYLYAKNGPWGFTNGLSDNTVSDTATPKLLALAQIGGAPKAAATYGTLVPATVYLKDPNSGTIGADSVSWYASNTAYRINAGADYNITPIRVLSAGTYSLNLTVFQSTGLVIRIYINGISQGTVSIADGGTNSAVRDTTVLSITLPKGQSLIRLKADSGTGYMRDIVIA